MNEELPNESLVNDELLDEPLISQSETVRRTAAVVVALVALGAIIVVGIILLATRGLPDNARDELTRYLGYRYPSVSSPAIVQVGKATRPWLFKRESSSGSYSDTIHYLTTAYMGSNAKWRSSRALPYPPTEVWCVRLASADPGAEVVVVALHEDGYNAGWIVHELPAVWSAADRNAVLAELDCGITFGN